MKKLIITIFLLITIGCLFYYKEPIVEYIMNNFIYDKEVVYEKNTYTKKDEIKFVDYTTEFVANNYQDVLNIIYSGLNNGTETFYFYCDKEYSTCRKDVEGLIDDSFDLSNINNFIHPFNSFSKLIITINGYGRVSVDVLKTYNEEEIALLNKKVDQVYNKLIKNNMTTKEKIKVIHDYIINITKYDEKKADLVLNNNYNVNTKYKSHTAIGPLLQGYAICGGYSDAMALFLEKMDITNYKIASKAHVWNLVKVDGKWLHLDLTWDDPVISTGEDLLLHNFFLISTKQLKNIDVTQHQYYEKFYLEANY